MELMVVFPVRLVVMSLAQLVLLFQKYLPLRSLGSTKGGLAAFPTPYYLSWSRRTVQWKLRERPVSTSPQTQGRSKDPVKRWVPEHDGWLTQMAPGSLHESCVTHTPRTGHLLL